MYQVQIRLVGGPNSFESNNMIILLAGRGQSADHILDVYNRKALRNAILVAVQPLKEWYPCPNGINDQTEAIDGLKFAIPNLNKLIFNLQNQFNIPDKDTVLVGFSAGAVMALQILAYTDKNYAGCVSHAGAILDPENLPQAQNNTPILLIHTEDDDCFEWEERYLPMKKALLKQGFNVTTKELSYGGHQMDIEDSIDFLKGIINICME